MIATILLQTRIQHFPTTSFGDVVYGCQVTIYLDKGVEASTRLTMWNALANDHSLELLPPLEQCFSHPKGYIFPLKVGFESPSDAYVKWKKVEECPFKDGEKSIISTESRRGERFLIQYI